MRGGGVTRGGGGVRRGGGAVNPHQMPQWEQGPFPGSLGARRGWRELEGGGGGH